MKQLPKGVQFALEIRNKNWLDEKFADLLRKHNVALVLQDQLWMPLPAQMNFDYFTADFTYVRLLGDRVFKYKRSPRLYSIKPNQGGVSFESALANDFSL